MAGTEICGKAWLPTPNSTANDDNDYEITTIMMMMMIIMIMKVMGLWFKLSYFLFV